MISLIGPVWSGPAGVYLVIVIFSDPRYVSENRTHNVALERPEICLKHHLISNNVNIFSVYSSE